MPHQDLSTRSVRLNSVYLAGALQWLLGSVGWSGVVFRTDCSWSARQLVQAALLWAWSDEATLGERFTTARRLVIHLATAAAAEVTDANTLAGSYQAFLKLLLRWTAALVSAMQVALRQRMERKLPEQWRIHGRLLFGVDGSKMELPRTKSHEAAYSFRRRRPGKKKRNRRKRPRHQAHTRKAQVPQMLITTMLHVGTGLPWDWRIGPSDSSEREHALDMLADLPPDAMLAGDAGFVGYDFSDQVLQSGRQLLVRVGANIRLLKKLGYPREHGQTVYLWPQKAMQKKRPPLVFRLVVAQGARSPVYLLVSVLNQRELSDAQVLDLYRRRWGVELFYRHLKQTFQRRKLKSRCAANARIELDWSLVGLWGMGLFAAVEMIRHQIPLSRLSMAGVCRAFRRMLRDYLHPADRQQTLCILLRQALTDTYLRTDKRSRNYPRKRPHPPPGKPTLKNATTIQVKLANHLRHAPQKG